MYKFEYIIKKFFEKPCIIFESYPNFADNTRPVYNELIRRGYNKKYNFFWYIDDNTYASLKKGKPSYWKKWDNSTLKNRIYNGSFYKGIKAVIMCNRFIVPNPIDDSKISFYLSHGTGLKDTRDYYNLPKEIDYCISSSKTACDILSYSLKYDINKIIPLGYPRNDAFGASVIDIRKILKSDAKKIIIWYPTFKQHSSGIKTNCKNAIPLIYNKLYAQKLNDFLIEKDIVIVIKPHFAQDLSYIIDLKLSNIIIINDEFYKENKITSYQFLNACDALLTDYSSVYFDYSLCDKPIGLIWEDIEDYKKKPGLIPDYERLCKGGVKIYNMNDLFCFLSDIVNDIDSIKADREKIRELLNAYTDGKNTQRVVDFIISKAKI